MKHLFAVIAIGFAALAAPASAHAGGYIGLGIGANAKLHGDLATHFDTSDTSSGRITLGNRTGPLAIEGSIFGTQLRSVTPGIAGTEAAAVSAELALKYFFSLQGRLEAYVGAGLNKTWITDENARFMDEGFSGNGYSASVGLSYSLSAIVGRASVWLDYTHTEATLSDVSRGELNGGARMLSLGLSFGF